MEGTYISRSFACARCDQAIHDSVEPMIVLDLVRDGQVVQTDGPFHEACAELEKEARRG